MVSNYGTDGIQQYCGVTVNKSFLRCKIENILLNLLQFNNSCIGIGQNRNEIGQFHSDSDDSAQFRLIATDSFSVSVDSDTNRIGQFFKPFWRQRYIIISWFWSFSSVGAGGSISSIQGINIANATFYLCHLCFIFRVPL